MTAWDFTNKYSVAVSIALVPLIAFAFYAGIQVEKYRKSNIWSGGMATYASETMRIALTYPRSLGAIDEEVLEEGECPTSMKTVEDLCDHRYLAFIGENNEKEWFLSGESVFFTKHPTPREGRYEDTFSSGDIESYCSYGHNPPISCEKGVNDNGLKYVKAAYKPACNGFETCGDDLFYMYFVETNNENYPVVVLLYDGSGGYRVPDDAINVIVKTLRPITK